MIIIMSPMATEENLQKVLNKIEREGLQYHLSKGSSRTIVGVIGEKKIISSLQMKAFDGVEKTVQITEKYKLVSREFKPDDTIVDVDGVKVGAGHLAVMAGPCAVENMEQLMEAADGMSVTLHRAFDVCRDPKEALEQAVSLGMNTILTSGQQNSAVKGAELLAELQRQAAGRIRIQAGGGICADAIRELYPKTGVTAYHMSGKIELASPMQYRKENVNMGLPSLSEYTLYRTDVKAVRSARAVLEEL